MEREATRKCEELWDVAIIPDFSVFVGSHDTSIIFLFYGLKDANGSVIVEVAGRV